MTTAAVESTSTSSKPLVSLAWQDVSINAIVLGISTPQRNGFQVYPKLDDKLPYRKGIKATSDSLTIRLPVPAAVAKQPQKVQSKAPVLKIASPHGISGRKLKPTLSDGKPFLKKCHICGKVFNKPGLLNRHLASHSGVKPFKCNVCGWGFFQYSNLKRHMASHTTSEGLKCPHCVASFASKSVLSSHIRDTHGEITPTLSQIATGGLRDISQEDPMSLFTNSSVSLTKVPKSPDKTIKSSPQPAHYESQQDPSASAGFSCTLCSATFDRVGLLNKHIKSHFES